MSLAKYRIGQDIKVELSIKVDGVAIDLSTLDDAFFYVQVNGITRAQFSYNAEDEYESLETTAETNQVVLPVTRAMTQNWPEGLITIIIDLVSTDGMFPEGFLDSTVVKYGMLWR
jgi:hypothetical protein